MLDFLLLRREDRDLWAANEPDTLQYVVLDEFHTYDGAQGTDVAMLLRRLGRTLGWPGRRPLGTAHPVATSATLGSGVGAARRPARLRRQGLRRRLRRPTVIGETRQTVEEACRDLDYLLPIPDGRRLAEAATTSTPSLPRSAGRRHIAGDEPPDDVDVTDVVELGEACSNTPSPGPCSPPSATRPGPGPTLSPRSTPAPRPGGGRHSPPADVEQHSAGSCGCCRSPGAEQGEQASAVRGRGAALGPRGLPTVTWCLDHPRSAGSTRPRPTAMLRRR
jgi:hypothetical protein